MKKIIAGLAIMMSFAMHAQQPVVTIRSGHWPHQFVPLPEPYAV